MSPSLSLVLRVGLLATLLLLAVVAILLFRRKGAARPDDDGLCAAPAGLVLLTYVPLIFYTHQVGVLDETMNDRYLAPVSVLILWLLFVGIDRLAILLRGRRARGTLPAHATIGLCVIWLLFYPSARMKEMVRSMQCYGSGGYSTAAWQELPLIRWLHAHPLEGLVRTNAPGAVYALTGMRALVSPHRDWDIPKFREQPGEYLVWFAGQPGSLLCGFEDLASELFLEEVVRAPGGGIYRFLPAAVCVFPESKVFSPCIVNGLWSRTFNSDDSDALGTIPSWVLRADGTTESVWELPRADGSVIRWHAGGPYTRSGATFQFYCGGQAGEAGGDANRPCQLEVHGVVGDAGATGTYRVTFMSSREPGALSGRWRIDLARPVRRFYSPSTGRHAYTMVGDEIAELSRRPDLWIDEGVAFHAFPPGRPPPETRPVYRFRAGASDTPFFTIREQEKTRLIDDPAQAWGYEGVAFYAYPEECHPLASLPVYRFWLATAGAHFYTASEAEKNTLLEDPAHRWVSEGIAWYALVDRP